MKNNFVLEEKKSMKKLGKFKGMNRTDIRGNLSEESAHQLFISLQIVYICV